MGSLVDQTHYEFFPGLSVVPIGNTPMVFNRPHSITAEVEIPDGGAAAIPPGVDPSKLPEGVDLSQIPPGLPPDAQAKLVKALAARGKLVKQIRRLNYMIDANKTRDPADVVLINYRRFAPFAAMGALEPLAGYLRESDVIGESDFYDIATESFKWRGQLMCIPQNISSLVVYYNRALFDEAGLPYPQDDWTREEFLATAQATPVIDNGIRSRLTDQAPARTTGPALHPAGRRTETPAVARS